jgi:hypothetical protein
MLFVEITLGARNLSLCPLERVQAKSDTHAGFVGQIPASSRPKVVGPHMSGFSVTIELWDASCIVGIKSSD